MPRYRVWQFLADRRHVVSRPKAALRFARKRTFDAGYSYNLPIKKEAKRRCWPVRLIAMLDDAEHSRVRLVQSRICTRAIGREAGKYPDFRSETTPHGGNPSFLRKAIQRGSDW